nr:Replicative DNA helicase [Chlamydiota bacterium]
MINSRPAIVPLPKESEMMVLGCMLSNTEYLDSGLESLLQDDFNFPEHRILFKVLENLHESGIPVDTHLVCNKLKDVEGLKSVGGAAYVLTLAMYPGPSAHFEYYLDQLIDRKTKQN